MEEEEEMYSELCSPNKRVKTLTLAPNYSPSHCNDIQSKGKHIIEQELRSSSDCCGICLSESGNGVSRGYIDCCNHYFCFVCIMEWAKVESKCPLCKRRFSTIRRPPKPPIFTSQRIVHVPVRDQVYHYNGNATIALMDPYSEIKCSVCQGMADESLILLCDLCDSAAHTYCIGLGATVPEGDWFCQDCTLLRVEHINSESNANSGIQIKFDTSHEILSANEHVSVSDIVREPGVHEVQKSGSTLMPPTSTNDETGIVDKIIGQSTGSQENDVQCPTKTIVRTLRHCRDLHDRIRVLRENWNAFQSGILSFSSRQDEDNISTRKSINSVNEGQSLSCLNQQSTAQSNNTEAHNIQKTWKMMDKAKSLRQGREMSSTVYQASKCSVRKLNTFKNADYMSQGLVSPNGQQTGSKDVGGIRPGHHHYHTVGKAKQDSSVHGKQKLRRQVTEAVKNQSEGSRTGCFPTHPGSKSSIADQTPSYRYSASVRNYQKLPAEKSSKQPAYLSSSFVSQPVVSNIGLVKEVNHTTSSHSKVKHPKERSESEKICVDKQLYDDAKSEIQSLVKLNLKLQTREQKLDVDGFKEVARLATHSILAACGMEHPKTVYCSIPGIICSHPSETQKSSLMPNSCRECFYVFVKDMINTVLLQKKKKHKRS